MGVVDLFCGIGGLSYGLSQAGLGVIAGIDSDKSCEYAYVSNNDGQFINDSIEKITGEQINELFGNDEIKILVGCAPCQPFSNHQKDKQNRANHKDWGLLYEFLRIIRETMPEIVSMENVPSLMKEVVFKDFVNNLIELGYHVNYEIHNAVDYGVAQNRRRLLLLASLYGEINFAEDTEEMVTVEEVIGHLEPLNNGETSRNDPLHKCSRLAEINLERIRASAPGGTWRDWDNDLLPECYRRESGQTYSSVYGRLSPDKPSVTLTTQFYSYGTGRYGHPFQDRALSLREGAMLQSFPEDYAFVEENENISIVKVARHIGNAVPPRLGEHIGISIVEHLHNNNLILD